MGYPQHARLVGRALKLVPKNLNIPCHRVVNCQGRLVPDWIEQKELLSREGNDSLGVFGIDLKIKKLTISELFLEVPGRIELP